LIDLRGHNEITLGKPIYGMGPQRNLHFSPGEKNVGMMSLFLGEFANTVHKLQCILKIREFEHTTNVVLVHDLPIW